MSKKAFLAIFLFGFLMTQTLAQSDRQNVGNLTYVLPAGWAAEPRGNSVVLRPTDAAKSRICMLLITAGLDVRGDFRTWAEQQWMLAKGTRREVTRQDIPAQTDGEGMEAIAITATLQIGNTPKHYHLFSAFRQGTKGATLSFVTDGDDYYANYKNAVMAVASSIKYSGPAVSDSQRTDQTVRKPPTVPADMPRTSKTPDESETQPALKPVGLQDKLPEPLPMPTGTADGAARILAQKVLAGGSDSLPALMRAVLSARHPIMKRDGTVLFGPAEGISNGIGCLDAELVLAADSTRLRTSIPFEGLSATVKTGSVFTAFDAVSAWRQDFSAIRASGNPTERFWLAFLEAIGSESGGRFTSPITAAADSPISPVQAYLILVRSFGALYLAGKVRGGGAAAEPEMDRFRNARGPRALSWSIDQIQSDPTSVRVRIHEATRARLGSRWASTLVEQFIGLRDGNPGISEGELNSWFLKIAILMWQVHYVSVVCPPIIKESPRSDFESVVLVRTKEYGATGGGAYRIFRIDFSIPYDVRVFLMEAAAELGFTLQDPDLSQYNYIVEPLNPPTPPIAEITYVSRPQFPTGTRIGGFLTVSFEGAKQEKKLGTDPDPIDKQFNYSITVRAPNPIAQVGGQSLPQMPPISKPNPQELKVTDWKGANWTGSIMVKVNGSGSWNSPDMTSQAEWRINRGFYTEFELDGSVSKGLIRGTVRTNPTAQGPRQYTTNFPNRNPPVNLIYDDYIKTRGPETNCIFEVIGEKTSTVEAKLRNPKGFNEEVQTGTHRNVNLQQESVDGITVLRLWELPPPVPITEKIELIQTGENAPQNKPPTVRDTVVSLLNRIQISAAGPLVINPAIVRRTATGLVIEDGIDDDFILNLGLKPGLNPKVRVTIKWKFELVGGTSTGALPKAIEQALAFASFRPEIDVYLGTMQVDEGPAIVKVSVQAEPVNVASCSLASRRIAGKLKHQPKTATESRPKK